MPSLKGTETEQNLKDAFAGETMANRRYLYFARDARQGREVACRPLPKGARRALI